MRGIELLLAEQLQHVGERLQQAVGADAVGAVAVLEAAQQLALEQQDHRHDPEHEREDHDRLDDQHAGRLDEGGVGERQAHALVPDGACSTSTSRARRSTSSVRVVLRGALDQVAPCPALTRRADAHRRLDGAGRSTRRGRGRRGARPRRSASSGFSSSSCCGRRKSQRGRVVDVTQRGPEVGRRREPQEPSLGGGARLRLGAARSKPSVAEHAARRRRARPRAPASARRGRRSRPASARGRGATRSAISREHRAGAHVRVELEARAARRARPARCHSAAHLAGVADRRAQALEAPVGVGDRALLLRVGLGREDDVGVAARPTR